MLVVDDNEDAATMLAEALADGGHHTTATALDGPAALETAAGSSRTSPCWTSGLPVMDGFELARQFRSHPGVESTRLAGGDKATVARSTIVVGNPAAAAGVRRAP